MFHQSPLSPSSVKTMEDSNKRMMTSLLEGEVLSPLSSSMSPVFEPMLTPQSMSGVHSKSSQHSSVVQHSSGLSHTFSKVYHQNVTTARSSSCEEASGDRKKLFDGPDPWASRSYSDSTTTQAMFRSHHTSVMPSLLQRRKQRTRSFLCSGIPSPLR